jgi:hypothetical protein
MSAIQTRSSDLTYAPRAFDSIASLLDTTMTGGTALVIGLENTVQHADEYVLLRSEVILEYEQMIGDLRRQLIHYKRLVAHLSGPQETAEDFDSTRVALPIDAQSIRVVNSVLQAVVPQSAIFQDFDEEEL